MKNLIFLLIGLVSTAASAQTTVYKVSKGNRIIYLGGTVHILREADYPLPKEFEQAYQDSDIITFETDTKSLTDPSVPQKMMKEGMFQDDKTLKTVLADSNYLALQAAFEDAGLPFAMMQKMKPALAVTTLSAMSMKSPGMTAEGVDRGPLPRAPRRLQGPAPRRGGGGCGSPPLGQGGSRVGRRHRARGDVGLTIRC